MKCSLALLLVATLAVAGFGQDSPPEAHGTACDFTDGTNELTWKIQNPSGPGDWWNSLKGTDCAGVVVDALVADFVELAGLDGDHARLGLYPDLGAGVPDVQNPLAEVVAPLVPAGDGFDSDSFYSIPCMTLGSTGVHVAVQYTSGDSHCWVSQDTSTRAGRTFFTSSGYATGAVPSTSEIDLYLGTPHGGAPGDLLINGASSATVDQESVVCVDFFASAVNTSFLLYFCVGGGPRIQLLPFALTRTDHPVLGGSCPGTWQLCATLNCNTPTAANLEFCTLWADQTDLKANGKPKIKVGASAFLSVTASTSCAGSGACFGQKDDCFVDLFIWAISNPNGPSDWFHVNHDAPTSGVTSLTSAAVSSFDFCGNGPCWAEVGVYPSNLSVDPTGTTPDVANPLSRVTGASACMAPSAADASCPLTLYDLPDYTVDSRAVNGVHVAARWPNGGSCIWLGSDTDGTDSPCGVAIPNDGTHSLFSNTSYTSPALAFTGANWLMQIDWQ